MKKNNNKKWYEYLWIASSIYLILGAFNILFAWLALICFLVPLIISISGGGKAYCNSYCGRGQLLSLLGNKLKFSRNRTIPKWIKSKYFRYGFLIFFLTILWTFKLPWNFNDLSNITPWIVQFAFGFYSIMLTSTILGLITMVLFKSNSWCVYCPMGTMTQGISIIKNKLSKE